MRITASEEMERQRLLKQRHNLFRDIGGVDFVYRVLHCTRGTTTHSHQLCKSLSAFEFQVRGRLKIGSQKITLTRYGCRFSAPNATF